MNFSLSEVISNERHPDCYFFEELESVATETKLEEKKRKDYVEPSVSDISNLF